MSDSARHDPEPNDPTRKAMAPSDAGIRTARVLQFPKAGGAVGRRADATVPTDVTITTPAGIANEPRLRTLIGDTLREERHQQERTLADVARAAAVSLPYLSEIERGRKEISSDLLDAVCDALDLTLAEVLDRCLDRLRTRAQCGAGIQLLAA